MFEIKKAATWLWKTTVWRDSAWEAMVIGLRPVRSRAGPWTRWVNKVEGYAAEFGLGEWKFAATDRKKWEQETLEFAQWS